MPPMITPTTDMTHVHTPATMSTPMTTKSAPPAMLMARMCRFTQAIELPTHPNPERDQNERETETETVEDADQQGTAGVAEIDRQRRHGRERRTRARSPSQGEHDAEEGRPREARPRLPRRFDGALKDE